MRELTGQILGCFAHRIHILGRYGARCAGGSQLPRRAAARVSGFSSQVGPLPESLVKDPDEGVQRAAASALEAVKAASAKPAPAAGAPHSPK
jgi:hypothetical protein